AVLLSDDLYLLNLEGEGCTLEKILEEYTEQEILAVLNQNLALDLEEIEVWEYKELIEKVEEIGGITVDVKEEEIQHINNYQLMMTGKGELMENQVTDSGEQTLNGIQTAAYLQVRYWPGGYFGKLDRWNQVIGTLLQKKGQEIIDCDAFILEGLRQSVYLEGNELGDALLCLQWEEELARLHELYYPDKEYVSPAFVKETDQAMKNQAAKVIEKARTKAGLTEWLFAQHFGSSPYIISLISNTSMDAETQDAWGTVKVFISGRELVLDEEGGRAVFLINLVLEDSGVLRLPEQTDEGRASVERFLYLKKGIDGWYVDGLLHNDLPSAQWWDGAQIQWEIYDFGFSDEDAVGIVTTSQEEYDSFVKKAQEAAQNKEQMR
ncbi:MAG: LCP family protein, partial [Lachnospiraceae bacterium]|nr:LCP family protein [Lachnospiraceae bacterium]